MDLLYGHDVLVADWVGEKLGRRIFPPFTAIGVVDTNALKGGLVFNEYSGPNIEVTMFGPHCLSRKVLKATGVYVFSELKCLRLTARTKRSNKLMQKLLPRLGFDYEATLKNYFGPTRADDALLFRLTEEYASKWM